MTVGRAGLSGWEELARLAGKSWLVLLGRAGSSGWEEPARPGKSWLIWPHFELMQ